MLALVVAAGALAACARSSSCTLSRSASFSALIVSSSCSRKSLHAVCKQSACGTSHSPHTLVQRLSIALSGSGSGVEFHVHNFGRAAIVLTRPQPRLHLRNLGRLLLDLLTLPFEGLLRGLELRFRLCLGRCRCLRLLQGSLHAAGVYASQLEHEQHSPFGADSP